MEEPKRDFGTGEPDSKKTTELAIQAISLDRNDVLPVGSLAPEIRQFWPDSTTGRLVIIGERYAHIIERHPEIGGSEESMIRTLLDPDEVHRNKVDSRMALLYRAQSTGIWMRLAVWSSDRSDRENSLLSARFAKETEVVGGRKTGRRIWRKG